MTLADQIAVEQKRAQRESLEKLFELQLKAFGLGAGCVAEHQFHDKRKWRFDFAWPARKVAIEIEGGAGTGGRHTRLAGFEGDAEKYNEAVAAGWKLFRFTSRMVKTGKAIQFVENFLKVNGHTRSDN